MAANQGRRQASEFGSDRKVIGEARFIGSKRETDKRAKGERQVGDRTKNISKHVFCSNCCSTFDLSAWNTKEMEKTDNQTTSMPQWMAVQDPSGAF